MDSPKQGPHLKQRDRRQVANEPGVADDPAVHPSKRRRVALACNACRTRKSRCNGGQPRCSLCEHLGFECTYEATDNAVNFIVSKGYMASFEDRLNLLESKVVQHDQLLYHNGAPLSAVKDKPQNSVSVEESHLLDDRRTLNVTELQELPPEEALTDGMAIRFVKEEDSGFFGPSSNIAFMRQIGHALEKAASQPELQTPGINEDFAHLNSWVVNASRPATPVLLNSNERANLGISIFDLPPEKETRDLIRLYFAKTGVLFPYIHEPTFLETYETIKATNFIRVSRTWLGLLNMIMAMASSASESPTAAHAGPKPSSTIFYERAYELCKHQMLRGTSLETVQYLLLMSQYLQGTQNSVQTWAIHGLAVKSAFSLGLHSTDAAKRSSSVVREMRKRAWYGCVMLDRSLSMTFGRPSAIPEDYVRIPLPRPLEDEQPGVGLGGPSNVKIMSVPFYTATMFVRHSDSKVMSSLYAQNLGYDQQRSELETITEIYRLEQELAQWQANLPLGLNIRSSSTLILDVTHDLRTERLNVILTLRFLNLQLLLHRPFVSRSLHLRDKDNVESGLLSSTENLAAGSVQTCVRTAEEIISIVHTIVTTGRRNDLLGAWWFTLYYTFSAALIIFGSLLASRRHAPPDTTLSGQIESAKYFLSNASHVLRELQAGNQTTQRCADHLDLLLNMLERWLATVTSTPDQVSFLQDVFHPSNAGALLDSTGVVNTVPSNDNIGLYDFPFEEIELGQFYIPDEFERWVYQGRR